MRTFRIDGKRGIVPALLMAAIFLFSSASIVLAEDYDQQAANQLESLNEAMVRFFRVNEFYPSDLSEHEHELSLYGYTAKDDIEVEIVSAGYERWEAVARHKTGTKTFKWDSDKRNGGLNLTKHSKDLPATPPPVKEPRLKTVEPGSKSVSPAKMPAPVKAKTKSASPPAEKRDDYDIEAVKELEKLSKAMERFFRVNNVYPSDLSEHDYELSLYGFKKRDDVEVNIVSAGYERWKATAKHVKSDKTHIWDSEKKLHGGLDSFLAEKAPEEVDVKSLSPGRQAEWHLERFKIAMRRYWVANGLYTDDLETHSSEFEAYGFKPGEDIEVELELFGQDGWRASISHKRGGKPAEWNSLTDGFPGTGKEKFVPTEKDYASEEYME